MKVTNLLINPNPLEILNPGIKKYNLKIWVGNFKNNNSLVNLPFTLVPIIN